MANNNVRNRLDEFRSLRHFDFVAPAEVVEWAREQTETGEFTPAMFELSELAPPSAADVDEYLARIAEQEGLPELAEIRAAARVVSATADSLSAGTIAPRAAARRLCDLRMRVPLLTARLSAFVSLADDWDEAPERRSEFDAAITAEVRRVALDMDHVIDSGSAGDGHNLVLTEPPPRSGARYPDKGTHTLTLAQDIARAVRGEKPATGLDGRPVVQPWAVGPGRIIAIVCAVVGLGLVFFFPPLSIALGALAFTLANTAWAHLTPVDPRRPLTVWGQILAGASVIGGVIGVIIWFSLR
ncbi:hypothetical protein SK224_04460 [Microbacterium sp. BG28]|uniref:hypothetical protein n=1 Tax=Microbacterium sp. BG28 TaxID=3097356 RepID=UPI002A5AF3D3|nr:hypothetical protein [Microbacterium sp. BG28]MDY0828376.1 hypothetical protein [Microbacterium sp. BG28]